MAARVGSRSVNSTQAEESEGDIQFWPVFCKLTRLAWFIAASYFFSLEIFTIGVLPALTGLSNTTGTTSNSSTSAPSDQIAGDTLAAVVFNTIVVIVQSVLFATNIVASGDLGKIDELEQSALIDNDAIDEQKKRVSATARNTLIIAAALCPFAMVPLYQSADLLIACGQEPAVAQEAQTFLRPSAFAVPAIFFALAFEKIIFSFLHTFATMAIGLTSFAIGTGLAIFLSINQQLGLYGIALAYLASNYLTMLSYAIYLVTATQLRPFQFFNCCRLGRNHFSQLVDILKMGGPMTLSAASDNIVSLLLGIFAGMMGTRELSDLNEVMNLYYFIFVLSGSHAEATCQQMRRAIKAKKYQKANRLAKYGLITTAVGAVPVGIASIVTLNVVAGRQSLFADTNFLIFSAAILLSMFQNGLLMQLRALSDNVPATVIDAACMLTGTGVGAAVGFLTSLKDIGLALGFAGGVLFSFVLLLIRWKHFAQPEVMAEKAVQSQPSQACCSCLNSRETDSQQRALTEGLLQAN